MAATIDLGWFGEGFTHGNAGDETGHGNGVTADVENAAAAEFVAEQALVGIELAMKAKRRLDDADFADGFCPEEFDEFTCLRVTPVHERFEEEHVAAAGGVDDGEGLGVIKGEGFFAEDVFAGFGGLDAPLGVHGVRRGDVDGLHGRVGEQRLVGAMASRHAELGAESVGADLGAAADGGEFPGIGLGKIFREQARDSAVAEDTPGK